MADYEYVGRCDHCNKPSKLKVIQFKEGVMYMCRECAKCFEKIDTPHITTE
jgi:hypothetical protein